jgi:DNA-binding SARP family transcriptional activator
MKDIKLYLFGQPQLTVEGEVLHLDRLKGYALLAYLALAKHRQGRDILATLLWPELDQEHALAALRSTLSSITTTLTSDWLHKDRTSLALNPDFVWVDVIAFQKYLYQLRSHKHESQQLCSDCVTAMNQAIELYRADFMTGFSHTKSNEYDDWQSIQSEALRRELSYMLRRLAEYYGKTGDFELAISYANRWLELDNLHEPAHRLLMHLYAISGQRSLALRQYQQCVEILDSELATVPDEESQQLYLALQSEKNLAFATSDTLQESGSVLPALPPIVVGRASVIAELKTRLDVTRHPRSVTVIQGWPGIGKSTTVAALAHDPEVLKLFPDGILWTSLGEVPNLLAELSNWSLALGLSTSEGIIEKLSKQLANALKNRRCLLIIDDVWQVEHAAPFNLAGQASATILTSRLNDVAQALAPMSSDIYRLPVLAEDAALDLLARLSPETLSEYPKEARALVADLEGLPLAIQVAGRLLHAEARLGWGVGNLLEELRTGKNLLNAQVPSDLQKIGQGNSPTIAALLRRSTESLDAAMQQRFALLGLFVPKPASFDLGALATLWKVADPKPFVRILVNRGLLEPGGAGRFQMHALLVLHARSLLQEMQDAAGD